MINFRPLHVLPYVHVPCTHHVSKHTCEHTPHMHTYHTHIYKKEKGGRGMTPELAPSFSELAACTHVRFGFLWCLASSLFCGLGIHSRSCFSHVRSANDRLVVFFPSRCSQLSGLPSSSPPRNCPRLVLHFSEVFFPQPITVPSL